MTKRPTPRLSPSRSNLGKDSKGNGAQRSQQAGFAAFVHPFVKSAAGSGRTPDARLDEAVGLADAIGLNGVHTEKIARTRPRPATYIGPGVVDSLAEVIDEAEIKLVCVDAALSPVQQRNLERA